MNVEEKKSDKTGSSIFSFDMEKDEEILLFELGIDRLLKKEDDCLEGPYDGRVTISMSAELYHRVMAVEIVKILEEKIKEDMDALENSDKKHTGP